MAKLASLANGYGDESRLESVFEDPREDTYAKGQGYMNGSLAEKIGVLSHTPCVGMNGFVRHEAAVSRPRRAGACLVGTSV